MKIVFLLSGLSAALLCLSFASPIRADDKLEMAKCAAIRDGANRLVCFDAVAVSMKATPQLVVAPADGKGKWKVIVETSPIDDSKNVFLTLEAEEPIRVRIGRDFKPMLLARCSEKSTDAYIGWGTFLGSGNIQMLLRFDKEVAKTFSVSTSTNHQSTFFSGSLPAIPFLKNAATHNTLLVQVTPYSESPVMATFDLRGLAEALTPLKEACGWQ